MKPDKALTDITKNTVLTITIKIPLGKKIGEFKVDGVKKDVIGNTYKLTVTKNHNVEVSFLEDSERYTVTLGEGISSTDPLTNLKSGSKVNITITPPLNKELDVLKIDGQPVTVTGNTYAITVTGNHNVTATFKDITFKLTLQG